MRTYSVCFAPQAETWDDLPEARQQRLVAGAERFLKMESTERQRTRRQFQRFSHCRTVSSVDCESAERFRELSPAQREALRKGMATFRTLDAEQRRLLRQRFQQLSPKQRARLLDRYRDATPEQRERALRRLEAQSDPAEGGTR